MKVRTFIEGGCFSEYQHVVAMERNQYGVVASGGGSPADMAVRFGDREIRHVSVYENIIRIELVVLEV